MTDHTESIRELLARIRKEDAAVHAFTFIAPDPEHVDGPSAEKPLGGLAIAMKDICDTADMPTGYGSKIYDGFQPPMDAAIVTALKAKGAFIPGKTTTTEFATSPPTPTLNPRDTRFTPGGSSAGSAAAVAAGMVKIALGTQTLGSVIRPASFCGVVGFKPTYGWFPTAGMKQLASSLDTIGFLAADVAHCERVYRALVPDDETPKVSKPKLIFSREPNWHLTAPDAKAAIEACIEKLKGLGVDVTDGKMPEGFDEVNLAANVIHDYQMHRSLAPEMKRAREKIAPVLADRIDRAGRWSAEDYRAAIRVVEAQRLAFDAFMKTCDGVLCLAAGGEAPLLELGVTGDPMMNSSWTALQTPCVSLPALAGANSMPIGLQIVGARNQDLKTLFIASFLEGKLGLA
ncbi:amidase [Terrihabitans soli]|uniref:Amidase n=1 Tax=Terrihabitans soli TaxID=708113 RepID=A0A6S6QK69_9HYPH|nr:amidase [Terrihabitans soli]BCJ89636.1 amidase [Terrihabitans soli]